MKGLLIAVQFLTRIPTPRVAVSDQDFANSIRWFPAVGILIGALIAAAAWAGAHGDAWVGALAALACWIAVTGALHLDGLADMADASGAAHKDRDRLLAVLADPHVGSFGVTAIALQLIAKLILLHALVAAQAWPTLILVPLAARIGPLAWARWMPPLHPGLGARFSAAVRPLDLILWGAILALAALAQPVLLATPLLIALWGLWLGRRIGGISGDGHGAGIELIETGLLLLSALAGAL